LVCFSFFSSFPPVTGKKPNYNCFHVPKNFAFNRFTFEKFPPPPPLLHPRPSFDRLNPKIYTICRASLIATPSGRLPQKRFTRKDSGSKLYRASWLFFTGIVTSISCAFSASSSLLQILRNFSRCHSFLMLLCLSSVTNLSFFFGFCAAWMLFYRCLQMEWWAAVAVVAIPSQPALLMWPCVSAARSSVLSPRASRAILHSRHPADCILPILVRNWLLAYLTYWRAWSLYSIHCIAALVSVQDRGCSIPDFHPKWSQWLQALSDTQQSGHVPFGCCLNPLLSPRALPLLSVSREIPFAPIAMLTRPPTPHWKRLLL